MSTDNHDDNQLTPESEEKQLCPSCIAPNPPAAHFCTDCGAPLDSYAAIGPLESIYAEGFVYRKASDSPRKFIVLLVMWLIFGATGISSIFVMLVLRSEGPPDTMLLCVFSLIISAAILWKTTRNYFKKRNESPKEDT
ncbi:MAG: zinc ribbon domain-containing protein [Verrucomicrobia bacterium]|nr:zinc ribbon domain-containing protein [Verrucomicrobiota bacterium]